MIIFRLENKSRLVSDISIVNHPNKSESETSSIVDCKDSEKLILCSGSWCAIILKICGEKLDSYKTNNTNELKYIVWYEI